MDSFVQNNQEIISVSDVNDLAKGLLEKDLLMSGFKEKFQASPLMGQVIGTLP